LTKIRVSRVRSGNPHRQPDRGNRNNQLQKLSVNTRHASKRGGRGHLAGVFSELGVDRIGVVTANSIRSLPTGFAKYSM